METAATVAEVFSTLKSVGLLGAAIALCFLGFAVWVSREAFRTGRTLRLRVSPHSLEISLGPERETQGTQLEKGETSTSAETCSHETSVGQEHKKVSSADGDTTDRNVRGARRKSSTG